MKLPIAVRCLLLVGMLFLAAGCGGKPPGERSPDVSSRPPITVPRPPEEQPPAVPPAPYDNPDPSRLNGPKALMEDMARGDRFPRRELADGSFCYEVEVFYATDRLSETPSVFSPSRILWEFAWPLGGLSLAAGLLTAAIWSRQRRVLAVFAALATVFSLAASHGAAISIQQLRRAELASSRVYGAGRNEFFGRGRVEFGRCQVTIPHDHRVGALESPNLLYGELKEEAGDHIVLVDTRLMPAKDFFPAMKAAVAADPRKQALVFIHGYNVPFKDAARRTAQMAYDLKFQGAAMFYSWPSQATYRGYFLDEQNIEWTVPQLKQVLRQVVEESEAESIHLIAHSMGNRALAQVLKEFSLETRRNADGTSRKLFNQVVLAAPDIDAGTFANTIAPSLRDTAERVTLYASSGDRALQASRLAHGFRRVGDSSNGPLIVEGIDTVDVSRVDTSLIGHSYYGGNAFLIDDLRALLHRNAPCSGRSWLEELRGASGNYWVFRPEIRAAAAAAAEAADRTRR